MDPSTLRDRLRGIVKPGRAIVIPVGESPGVSGFSRTVDPTSPDDVLGGGWREGVGRSYVVTRRLEPDAVYGAQRIEDVAKTLCGASDSAALMGAHLARAPFLFLDLETTGLSGGAGTYAFLVGCGWFDADGAFVTEQHLLTDDRGERPMLDVVAADLGRAGALVTFNGKSFDAPLLETRYAFHRLESPCAGRPHVDLLHPARRFWGSPGDAGCSLVELERHVLGMRRTGDVPGFEIPARYFHFVRTGDARPLVGVLEHNRLDLLSLACLTARVFHLVEAGPEEARHAREALALGRVYERAGLDERAEDAFERALALSPGSKTSSDASMASIKLDILRALAEVARRQRRYEAAAVRWQELLETPACSGPIAREAIRALAIHHEHRARDLVAAKEVALRGLACEAEAAWGDAVRHRLARIERKIVSERRSLFPSSTLPPSCDSPMSARRTSS